MRCYSRPVLLLMIPVFCVVGRLAAAPEKVLILGDSMMMVTSHATELALEKRGGVETLAEPELGTGLARLDAMDWMAKARKLVSEFDPDVSMVWFGTNDNQPMQTQQGVLRPDDPRWMAEYTRRIGEMMDILCHRDGAKVYWLELPVMRDKLVNEYVQEINRIALAEADKRDQVVFFKTDHLLSRKPKTFTMYLIDRTGRPIKVREPDGVHLGRPGADIVADAFVKELF